MPSKSVSSEPTAQPAEPVEVEADVPAGMGDINAAMEAQAPEAPPSTDPPGSDELTAENVRRYPHLFTDEQKASIPTDELPETDVEKAQREQAEAEA